MAFKTSLIIESNPADFDSIQSLCQGERRGGGGGGEGGGGKDNALFLHCRNCDSLTVFAVAHFDPYLPGRHLASIGRLTTAFLGFSFCLP